MGDSGGCRTRGDRVCCCAPQHTYAWLPSAVPHTYSHYTQQQQKSLGCSTKLHSCKTKNIFWISFIGNVQKYSRDVVLRLPLFWNISGSFPSLILPSHQSPGPRRKVSQLNYWIGTQRALPKCSHQCRYQDCSEGHCEGNGSMGKVRKNLKGQDFLRCSLGSRRSLRSAWRIDSRCGFSANRHTVCLAIRLSPPLLLCGPCSMLGVKSLGKLFPLLGYEIFHSLVPDNGKK